MKMKFFGLLNVFSNLLFKRNKGEARIEGRKVWRERREGREGKMMSFSSHNWSLQRPL